MEATHPSAVVQPSAEQQLISIAREASEAIDNGKWTIGLAALRWQQQTCADSLQAFATAIDVELDSVQRYAHVWRLFGDATDSYPRLKWSHFRAATGWDDADDWLVSANENQWSVAMMKRMRAIQQRADNGEDLSEGEAVTDDHLGHNGTDAPSPDVPAGISLAADQPHVGDVGQYQKPPCTVASTPRDFEQEATRPHQPVPDGDEATATVEEPSGRGRAETPDPESTLQAALDRIESLVNAWNNQRHEGELRRKFAAKLRRWADQMEVD